MPGLLDIDFVRQKLLSVIDQVRQLQLSEFPYDEPKAALVLLIDMYKSDLSRLDGIDETTDVQVRQQVCAHANARVARYYSVMGFILRSTNVRNAFEIYDPLLQMCRKVYGIDAKLIISSEWNFSPFTYPAVTDDLPNLMFIGLPSTEAGNSLILPLAGHELGHSIWRKKKGGSPALAIDKKLQQSLLSMYVANWKDFQKTFNVSNPDSDLLTDLFLRNIWTQSYKLAIRQVEELFCDLIGLRIFGESFLYSFLYLIAPNIGDRAAHYPALVARVTVLTEACKHYAIEQPKDFQSYFLDPPKRIPSADEFVLKMADLASEALTSDLIEVVREHITKSALPLPDNAERDRIVKQFCALSPASSINALGDIINAGWKLRLDWKLWSKFNFDAQTRLDVLNDLVFKTMEVMEFESKTGAPANA
ncbi:hypothetical protein [Mesorhizobium sp. M0578]|uniref:hypothetical protein n=1 Tax=unclassified Mesorhizobium TaxID=325217 RepID=UPI0033389235